MDFELARITVVLCEQERLDAPMDKLLVFIDGSVSWCVPEGSPAERLMRNEGHELIYDAATSEFDGWTYAAIHHGCIPNDYDDGMKPGLIWEPLPLYRSVSILELEAIVECGEIRGSDFTFNPFERRPFVFFSGAPTSQTIWQGEDVTRLAEYMVYLQCKEQGIDFFKQEHSVLRQKYLETLSVQKAIRKDAEYTSVVLKTSPIGLGLHYSVENGSTGMNGEDEYGLFPGQVKLSDIVEVMWVKDGVVVEVTTASDIEDKLARNKSEPTGICI